VQQGRWTVVINEEVSVPPIGDEVEKKMIYGCQTKEIKVGNEMRDTKP